MFQRLKDHSIHQFEKLVQQIYIGQVLIPDKNRVDPQL
jgi:hypothetical protein